MKYALNLEMVNMKISRPNAFYMNSSMFWTEYFRCIAAAGFDTIEMQYNPYKADPYSFEIGRCGVPVSRFAIQSKYGSVPEFMRMLSDIGITRICAVHVDANETLNEIIALDGDPGDYFGMMEELYREVIDFCAEVNVGTITATPTPEAGMLREYYFPVTGETEDVFLKKTAELFSHMAKEAGERGTDLALRNEYWSLLRGGGIVDFIKGTDSSNIFYSPDLAHLYIAGADTEKIMLALAERIRCPRFNDTCFKDEHENYKRLNAEIPVEGSQRIFYDIGDGDIDIPYYNELLSKLGYDGTVSCESRKTLDVYKGLLKTRWYIDHVLCR